MIEDRGQSGGRLGSSGIEWGSAWDGIRERAEDQLGNGIGQCS